MVSVIQLQLIAVVAFFLALLAFLLQRRPGKQQKLKRYVKVEKRLPSDKTPTNFRESSEEDFRLRYPANFRTDDGHFVRSKAELIIDNWLHRHRILHEYEKKIPGEYMMCDFYLPDNDIYVEYWGGTEPHYEAHKKEKLATYGKKKLKLISLYDSDIEQLEHKLTQKLRAFGIRV